MHTFAKVNKSRREKKVTAVDNTEELTVHVRGGGEGEGKEKKKEKRYHNRKKKRTREKTLFLFIYIYICGETGAQKTLFLSRRSTMKHLENNWRDRQTHHKREAEKDAMAKEEVQQLP